MPTTAPKKPIVVEKPPVVMLGLTIKVHDAVTRVLGMAPLKVEKVAGGYGNGCVEEDRRRGEAARRALRRKLNHEHPVGTTLSRATARDRGPTMVRDLGQLLAIEYAAFEDLVE
ncbi:hypothetical protein PHYPSEUDO_003585 [Phytophthora pseudosyringae]|uniref:Uncharacterized protein n=1 Tax=Phytophthora pseudosyringae TaxID=221518 RepID=A0A8T1VTJ1_9STRA|nr:hypothetical protein PHYPSEUDO_003585 [Phytophthora pseudosyringae]